MELGKQAYIIAKNLIKKGLSNQEALDVLDNAKAYIEEGISLKQCKHCKTLLDEDAVYCTHCGEKQKLDAETPSFNPNDENHGMSLPKFLSTVNETMKFLSEQTIDGKPLSKEKRLLVFTICQELMKAVL